MQGTVNRVAVEDRCCRVPSKWNLRVEVNTVAGALAEAVISPAHCGQSELAVLTLRVYRAADKTGRWSEPARLVWPPRAEAQDQNCDLFTSVIQLAVEVAGKLNLLADSSQYAHEAGE